MSSIAAIQMSNYYYYNYYKKTRPIGFRNFNNKYHRFFEKANDMFSGRPEFNPFAFIYSIMLEGFIYPQQIPVEKNWETYERNKASYSEEESEAITLAKEIVSGAKALNGRTVKEFLENSFNKYDMINGGGNYSKRIFFFSKEFRSFYEDNEGKFNRTYDFSIMRQRVFAYPKIIKKIKEILKDDYFEQV